MRRHLCTGVDSAVASSSAPIAECCYRRKTPLLQNPEAGSLHDALDQLDRYDSGQNQSTYASLIRLCGNARSLESSKRLHRHLVRHGYDRGTYLGNLLVEMFGKCNSVEDCQQAFQRIHEPNVYSCNILMAAYNGNSQVHEARAWFNQMPKRDTVSWNAIIAAYAQYGVWSEAEQLFEKMPLWDCWSWNACLRSYTTARCSQRSKLLFDLMPQRTVISWTLLVTAHAQNGKLDEAIIFFEKPPMRDLPLWNVILNGFVTESRVDEALKFFDSIPQHDTLSWNAKMKAYVLNGNLHSAKLVFDGIPDPDVASYTTLISSYFQHGKLAEARRLFDQMPVQDTYASNAMVSGYSQNGCVAEARSLFNSMPSKNLVTWNSMIAGYGQNGNGKEAVQLFRFLDLEGMQPDGLSFVSALDACASHTALPVGRILHAAAAESGFEQDLPVANSLINMYGRCGSLSGAEAVFARMVAKNVITWTSMAAAYAQCNETKLAFHLVKAMVSEGVMPNDITFTILFSLCSQAGQLGGAWENFMIMSGDFGIEPKLDHYCCMADLLARAGHLKLAQELIDNMPYKSNDLSLRSLLSACRSHEATKLGGQVAAKLRVAPSQDASPYVLLSNMLAEAQKH